MSVRVPRVYFRSLVATSTPPLKVAPPLLAVRARLRPAERLASVALMASAPALVLVMVRSRAAESLLAISILPTELMMKSSVLAAALPSTRTPTPASVALRLMRPAYMPPRALESMA